MANFLFGSTPLPNATSTSSTLGPDWYNQYLQSLYAKSSEVAGEPYQTYGGQRVAGFTPDQTAAFDMTRANSGAYQPNIDQASAYATQAGADFGPDSLTPYMNPYMDQVVNQIATRGGRNLTENLLPGVNQTFTGAGQFGGTRNADFNLRAIRDTNESVLGEQAKALSSGYTTALDAYNNDKQAKLNASQALTNTATQGQTLATRDAAALEGIGQTQQAQQQKNLDLGYQDFQAQQNYPKDQTSWLANVFKGQSVPQTTTTTQPGTTSQQSPSVLGQLAGVGLAGYGVGKAVGWFKKGGAVKARYAEGGDVKKSHAEVRRESTPEFMRRIENLLAGYGYNDDVPEDRSQARPAPDREIYYDKAPTREQMYYDRKRYARGGPVRGIGHMRAA